MFDFHVMCLFYDYHKYKFIEIVLGYNLFIGIKFTQLHDFLFSCLWVDILYS